MKPFPLPVVALGPGTHSEEETLDYLPMPKEMNTFEPPRLPEHEDLIGHDALRPVLEAALAALAHTAQPEHTTHAAIPIPLQGLGASDLALLNQVLGEGETSIRIDADGDGLEIRIQESVFTGVWRVLTLHHGVAVDDCLEVGAMPTAVRHMARPARLAGPTRLGRARGDVVASVARRSARLDHALEPPKRAHGRGRVTRICTARRSF